MFSILSPQDGHRETPRASQKVVPEQGERAVVKLQVDRLVAMEVVGQQPVAVLAARRTQVGAEAGLPLVGDHMPPRHVKRPPPPNVELSPLGDRRSPERVGSSSISGNPSRLRNQNLLQYPLSRYSLSISLSDKRRGCGSVSRYQPRCIQVDQPRHRTRIELNGQVSQDRFVGEFNSIWST